MLNLSLKRNMPHLFRDKESFLIKKDIYLLSIGTCFNYNCSSFDFITVLRRLIVHIFLQWIYCSANCYFQLQRFQYFVIMIIFLKMVTFEIWSPISSDGCCIVRRIGYKSRFCWPCNVVWILSFYDITIAINYVTIVIYG